MNPALLPILLLAISSGVSVARDSVRSKRQNDLTSGLNSLIQQLTQAFGGGGGKGNNDGNPNNNNGPLNPNGGLSYCDQNPLDCQYLSCLADNFQNSDQAATLKQGGQVLTDRNLRQALQNDPTISQVACDKVGMSNNCDAFKSFLGLIDKFDPGPDVDPAVDPNRGKRAAAADQPLIGATVDVDLGRRRTTDRPSRPTPGSRPSRPTGSSGNTRPSTTRRGTWSSTSRRSSSSRQTTTKGGKQTPPPNYDYYGGDSDGGSGITDAPKYQPKDCDALIRGQGGKNNNRNNNNNNNNNNNRNNGRG